MLMATNVLCETEDEARTALESLGCSAEVSVNGVVFDLVGNPILIDVPAGTNATVTVTDSMGGYAVSGEGHLTMIARGNAVICIRAGRHTVYSSGRNVIEVMPGAHATIHVTGTSVGHARCEPGGSVELVSTVPHPLFEVL